MPVQALVGCAARKNSVLRHGTNRLNARRGLLAPYCLAGGCVPPINLKNGSQGGEARWVPSQRGTGSSFQPSKRYGGRDADHWHFKAPFLSPWCCQVADTDRFQSPELMDGCVGQMWKNLIKQKANRRGSSTRAARTVCAHSSNFPGTFRACSRCLPLLTARTRSKASVEEENAAVLTEKRKWQIWRKESQSTKAGGSNT